MQEEPGWVLLVIKKSNGAAGLRGYGAAVEGPSAGAGPVSPRRREDSGFERPRGNAKENESGWEGGGAQVSKQTFLEVELNGSQVLPGETGWASESTDKPGAWTPELFAFLTRSLLCSPSWWV